MNKENKFGHTYDNMFENPLLRGEVDILDEGIQRSVQVALHKILDDPKYKSKKEAWLIDHEVQIAYLLENDNAVKELAKAGNHQDAAELMIKKLQQQDDVVLEKRSNNQRTHK